MSRTASWAMSAAGFVCLAVAALSSQATPASVSQETRPQRPPVFRGGANFVYVDAYPRRDGRVVEGLTAADFQILEDGKPQKVELFEFISSPSNPADADRRDPNTRADADAEAADPRNRIFVIYLDLYHTTIPGSHAARQPIVDFLTRTITARDMFGVMTPERPVSSLVFARRTETIDSELTKYWTWGEAERGIFARTEIERRMEECSSSRSPGLGDAMVRLHREELLLTNLEALERRAQEHSLCFGRLGTARAELRIGKAPRS
jgi:hypothetical protein